MPNTVSNKASPVGDTFTAEIRFRKRYEKDICHVWLPCLSAVAVACILAIGLRGRHGQITAQQPGVVLPRPRAQLPSKWLTGALLYRPTVHNSATRGHYMLLETGLLPGLR